MRVATDFFKFYNLFNAFRLSLQFRHSQKLQDVDSVKKNIAVETKQAEVIEMDELFDYINEKKTELT